MRLVPVIAILLLAYTACVNNKTTSRPDGPLSEREPNDSADYNHLRYNLYVHKNGQLCERKLVLDADTADFFSFTVYYDSIINVYKSDTLLEVPLNKVIDVNSFEEIKDTEFSKDKKQVYYFQGTSDGGVRLIIDKADPPSFKRLCEYRWGIDKNYVFYMTDVLEGLDVRNVQVLYPPDTTDPFVQYIKDTRKVFYEADSISGVDAASFHLVANKEWDAEDKYNRFKDGKVWSGRR